MAFFIFFHWSHCVYGFMMENLGKLNLLLIYKKNICRYILAVTDVN